MREIKFRAWNPETKKMVDLQTITPLALSIDPSLVGARIGVYVPDDDNIPVMQYTGIKDNNDKEIYEGDIVHYDTEDGIVTSQVVWECDEDEGRYISGFIFKVLRFVDYPEDRDYAVGFEVIGNIYENPELLKETT